MKHLVSRIVAVAVAGGILAGASSLRAEAPVAAPLLTDEPAMSEGAAGFRVVVLRNGHAVAGQFEQTGDRITISSGPGHSVRIPLADVDIVVPRWRDAYRLQRSRLRAGDMADRLRLAQWCLRHNQVDSAADMLLEMSRLQPNHSTVRALEQQLALRAGAGIPPSGSRVVPASFESGQSTSETVDSGTNLAVDEDTDTPTEEASSLALDVEPAAITEFTRTIQPLLMNRCGMLHCHAPTGPSSFKLQRAPTGKLTPKDLTWANLNAVFKRIDATNPDESELLVKATTAHGKARRAPIEALEVRQRNRLRDWIRSVVDDGASQKWAAENMDLNYQVESAAGVSAGLRLLQGGVGSVAPSNTPAALARIQGLAAGPPETGPSLVTPGQRLVPDINDEEELQTDASSAAVPSTATSGASSDPFDPSEFNRRNP